MESWITAHFVEVLGVVFSILYLYFSIRQRILLWPMGMASAILYMVVFYQSKFYADMGLNGYYVIVSIYGWILWRNPGNTPRKILPVSRVRLKQAMILVAITLAGFLGIGVLLDKFTDSPIPYWDALTTAMSFTATWMLARKILEHWLLWIFVDAISMGLYLYRGLYPTLILFAIYTSMAFIGYFEWKKSFIRTAH